MAAVLARAQGLDGVADWRAAHTAFWASEGHHPNDDATVVVEVFRPLHPLQRPSHRDEFSTAVARLLASTVVELDQLGVHPDARGAGVGPLLVEDVLAHARGIGASDVLLTVWAANDGARRLDESLGFAVRQHRTGVWLRDR